MPICSTLMDNISSQITIFTKKVTLYGCIKRVNLSLYPPYECTLGGGGYYGFVIVTSLRKHFIKRTKILIGVLPHVTCIFI